MNGVGPAGDVWVTNNWHLLRLLLATRRSRRMNGPVCATC
jgi:hypothetical protein